MNARERAELEKELQFRPGGCKETLLPLTVGCGGLVIYAGVAVTAFILDFKGAMGTVMAILFALLAVPAIVCLYIVIQVPGHLVDDFKFKRWWRRKDIPEIEEALRDGRVSVKKVVTHLVVEIEGDEHSGVCYVFDVGEGKSLLLKGDEFLSVVDDAKWPNTEFEIVRTVHGDRWIGVFCLGEELAPSRSIPIEECDPDFYWGSREELVNGSAEEYVRSLRVKA